MTSEHMSVTTTFQPSSVAIKRPGDGPSRTALRGGEGARFWMSAWTDLAAVGARCCTSLMALRGHTVSDANVLALCYLPCL